MARALSKSRILSRLQCPKRLWLQTYKPEVIPPYDARTQRMFAGGHALHFATHTLFPGGILIEDQDALAKALRATQRVLETSPGRPLFEGAFSKHNVLVRADVIHWTGEAYRLIEVKSSSEVKDYHYTDCAGQAYVIEAAGYPLDAVELAHLNTDFFYEALGHYDGILTHEDVTEAVTDLKPQVPEWIAHCQAALAGPEPEIAMGAQCTDPFDCPFIPYCSPEPVPYPVESLPNDTGKRVATALLDAGIRDIRDIPEDFPLNDRHAWIRAVTKAGRPDINPRLVRDLRELPYPRHYLDFETIDFVVPRWLGTRPREQIPCQWSCHREEVTGAVTHVEFLDVSGQNPARGFAESLIDHIGPVAGPIVVYSHYEKTILNRLMGQFPDLADPLQALVVRLVDILPMLRRGYYHPDMKGSWSIKAVLPTVAPALTYADLEEVQDGSAAQLAYEEAIDPNTTEERKRLIRTRLLEYCKRDTEAMLVLVQRLSASG